MIRRLKRRKWKKVILNSGMFDHQYYIFTYPDVRLNDVDPLNHYLKYGANEGRNPNKDFDTEFYLNNYPDVKRSGMNPLVHYILYGQKENRMINAIKNNIKKVISKSKEKINQIKKIEKKWVDNLDIKYEIVKNIKDMKKKKISILVTHSFDGEIKEHTKYLIEHLKKNNIQVILAVASDNYRQPVDIDMDSIDGLVIRENVGFDFALWAAVLNVNPNIWQAEEIYFLNDSIFGPLCADNFTEMIKRISESKADFIGLTENHERDHHLQSFFFVLKNNALISEPVKKFWFNIKSYKDKQDVIYKYELELSKYFIDNNLKTECLYPIESIDKKFDNPTLCCYSKLIEKGFPFIKVELLDKNPRNINLSEWESRVKDTKLLTLIKSHLSDKTNKKKNYIEFDESRPYYIQVPATFKDERILPGIRPNEKYDYSLKTPFSFIDENSVKLYGNKKIASIIHIYYVDLLDDILNHLANIPVKCDIYISTDTADKKAAIEKAFLAYTNGNVTVKTCQNRGRDVAPMLIDFKDVFSDYEWILHIHSKKSPHNKDELYGWRDYLFNELLGSKEKVLSIFNLLNQDDIGIVFPEHFKAVKKSLNFGYNYPVMSRLLSKMKIDYSQENILEFPSSTMFWMKTKAIAPLVDLDLSYDDFDEESGQVDGTLAHSIERSFLLICEASNFEWCKICSDQSNSNNLIRVKKEEELKRMIKTLFYRILDNKILFNDTRQIRDFNEIKTYKDTSDTKRLNIILPTLNKEKIFGGISTALKFFNDLKEYLGNDFQYRILVSSEIVNAEDIINFKEYVLLNLHSKYDDHDHSIVDISRLLDGSLGIRENDIFIATAWWTAMNAYSFHDKQAGYFGKAKKVVYMIQDHEPGFYNWSSKYILSQSTYLRPNDTISVINSEELANFMMDNYKLSKSFVLPFRMNQSIKKAIKPTKKEKIIMFYGRPSVDRNAFEIIVDALYKWQKNNYTIAKEWQIISVGESYPSWRVNNIENIKILGKLSLEEYADHLNRSYLGISLMVSPHPSYPPLEMAYSNVKTITNRFEGKDLSKRSDNIISIVLDSADSLSDTIEDVITSYTPDNEAGLTDIKDIECSMEEYSVKKLFEAIN